MSWMDGEVRSGFFTASSYHTEKYLNVNKTRHSLAFNSNELVEVKASIGQNSTVI